MGEHPLVHFLQESILLLEVLEDGGLAYAHPVGNPGQGDLFKHKVPVK